MQIDGTPLEVTQASQPGLRIALRSSANMNGSALSEVANPAERRFGG
jgi:hypothetical protein